MDYFIYICLLILGGFIGFFICLLEQGKPKVHKYTPIQFMRFNQEICKIEGDGDGGERDLNIVDAQRLTRIYCKVFMKYCKHARLDFIRKYGS